MEEGTECLSDAINLDRQHRRLKAKLEHRVHVLRVLIRRYYENKRKHYSEYDFSAHCEAVLDNVLHRYEYDLEGIIDRWRKLVSKLKEHPVVCRVCNYRAPFCQC